MSSSTTTKLQTPPHPPLLDTWVHQSAASSESAAASDTRDNNSSRTVLPMIDFTTDDYIENCDHDNCDDDDDDAITIKRSHSGDRDSTLSAANTAAGKSPVSYVSKERYFHPPPLMPPLDPRERYSQAVAPSYAATAAAATTAIATPHLPNNTSTNISSSSYHQHYQHQYDSNLATASAYTPPPLHAMYQSQGSLSPNFTYPPSAMMFPPPPPSLQQHLSHQQQQLQQAYPQPPPQVVVQPSRFRTGSSPKSYRKGAAHQQTFSEAPSAHFSFETEGTNDVRQQQQLQQAYPPPPPQVVVQPSRSRMGSSPKSYRKGATHQQSCSGAPSMHFPFETEGTNDVYASLLRGTEQTVSNSGYGSVKPSALLEVSARHAPWSFSSQQQHHHHHHPTTTSGVPVSFKPGGSSSRRLPPSRANSIGSMKQQSSTEAATAIGASGLGHSMSPLRDGGGGAHRRANSDGDRRMAAGAAKSSGGRGQMQLPMDPSRMTRRSSTNSNRWRANSESQYSPKLGRPPTTASPSGSVGGGGGSSTAGGGHHRRGSSIASVGAMSYMSDASMVSVVSNIQKSVFYAGVQQHTGHAQLSFPLSRVHLITIESATNSKDIDCQSIASTPYAHGVRPINSVVGVVTTIDGYPLKLGRLYKVPVSNQEFEEYHRVFEDSMSGYMGGFCDDDDLLDMEDNQRGACRCDCPNCTAACGYRTGGGGVLAANYFCLTIEDTIYRRLLDDICASQAMPCGLYFCGHHEDVSRPSISIAVFCLVLVFVIMGYVALIF